jgi:hypothetical protein
MRVYKEKQFLIFKKEDGKVVKYDFSTQKTIGFSGKEVKSLSGQLKGYTISDVIMCCEDRKYADFLKFVYNRSRTTAQTISGLLNHVPAYKMFESYFAADYDWMLKDVYGASLVFKPLKEIPNLLIKFCKKYNLTLTKKLWDFYVDYPTIVNTIYNISFDDLNEIKNNFGKAVFIGYTDWQNNKFIYYFAELVTKYRYNTINLINYIDYLITYEGLRDDIVSEIYDYAKMSSKLSPKFDKYPRHFLSIHTIACRNYNRLKECFDEQAFIERIDTSMEYTYGDYQFIYPKSTQEIKDEAVQQNNCVASYIKKVIDGECDILFLRKKNDIDHSLVTIEVRNNQIIQAKRKFNNDVLSSEQEAIDKWNEWRKRTVQIQQSNKEKERLVI